ncbi:TolC family protein [Sphingobacterium hungaricum]
MYQKILVLLFSIFAIVPALAQTATQEESLTIADLFARVQENNPSLKIIEEQENIAREQIKIIKTAQLPQLNLSASAFYLADIEVFDTQFNQVGGKELPNYGNVFSLDANQLLWKGGQVKETVRKSELQAEMASLQLEDNTQEIKLIALQYYLELYKLYNQSQVYSRNIELAKKRLDNVQKFYKQGMITRNDVLRAELQISQFELEKLSVDNLILIRNKQLAMMAGLPETVRIQPSEDAKQESYNNSLYQDYKQEALEIHPKIRLTRTNIEVAESDIKIARKNKYPYVSLFAVSNYQRPITNLTPAMDLYFNTFNAGVSVKYDISNFWKNNQTVQQRSTQKSKAEAEFNALVLSTNVEIDAAKIKHSETLQVKEMLQKNKELAYENYRIIENKYNNQLVILLDLIDASNSQLAAELQYVNAEANILQAYYNLLRVSGKLN